MLLDTESSSREKRCVSKAERSIYAATYSLILRDPGTGWIGSAIASKYLAVGASVSHSMAGVGVVHGQFWCCHDTANRILKNLAWRMSVNDALKTALAQDPLPEKRQLLVMDWMGNTVVHTGADPTPITAQESRQDLAVAGNTLVSAEVIDAMLRSLNMSAGEPMLLRLIRALEAGERVGGDSRGKQSAAVRIVQPPEPPTSDDCLDLRVDDHTDPIAELHRLYELAVKK